MQLNSLYSKTKVPSPSQYPRMVTCVSQPSSPMLRVYSHSETSNESPAFEVRIFSLYIDKTNNLRVIRIFEFTFSFTYECRPNDVSTRHGGGASLLCNEKNPFGFHAHCANLFRITQNPHANDKTCIFNESHGEIDTIHSCPYSENIVRAHLQCRKVHLDLSSSKHTSHQMQT